MIVGPDDAGRYVHVSSIDTATGVAYGMRDDGVRVAFTCDGSGIVTGTDRDDGRAVRVS